MIILQNPEKILILYHSGAGSTKTIAQSYYSRLEPYSADISPISLDYDYTRLQDYDFIIFAFPTYHCSPSKSMRDFIKNMPRLNKPKKAFVFTTYGLYSGNSLREFIKECLPKNIIIGGYSSYKAPATDGALLMPSFGFMFRYGKKVKQRIDTDISNIGYLIKDNSYTHVSPRFKLYTILNYPNSALGKAYKYKFRLLAEDCINCNKCVDSCIRHCWTIGNELPSYDSKNCEFCFRCIHNCPGQAIVLSKKTKYKSKLNQAFYNKLKETL